MGPHSTFRLGTLPASRVCIGFYVTLWMDKNRPTCRQRSDRCLALGVRRCLARRQAGGLCAELALAEGDHWRLAQAEHGQGGGAGLRTPRQLPTREFILGKCVCTCVCMYDRGLVLHLRPSSLPQTSQSQSSVPHPHLILASTLALNTPRTLRTRKCLSCLPCKSARNGSLTRGDAKQAREEGAVHGRRGL